MLRPSWARMNAKRYVADLPTDHPLCSPLFARLDGLPPILIQVGTDEILFEDSTRLAERCEASGVNASIHIFEGMWHDFQSHAGVLPTADEAVDEIAWFLKKHWLPARTAQEINA